MVRSASGGALALSGARLEPSGKSPAAILRDARLRWAPQEEVCGTFTMRERGNGAPFEQAAGVKHIPPLDRHAAGLTLF
jgi:hypothetical protein